MSGKHSGLDRRDFMRGSAGVITGAFLVKGSATYLKSRPLHGNSTVNARIPGQGTPVPVGVTLDLSGFPRGTSMAQAFDQWTQATGTVPRSTKVYLGNRQFPLRLDDKMTWCAQHDATAIICYNPAWAPCSSADAAALERSLAALKHAGLKNACVVLWTEPCGSVRPIPADQFTAGCRFYSSAARSAGWPLYIDLNGSAQNDWASYLPGDAVDGYAVDDYASRGNWQALWGSGGIATLADRDGRKFGWFEMGVSASHPVSQSTVQSYLHDATAYLASRKPGTTGPVTWWNGNGMNSVIPAAKHQDNAYIARDLYPALYRALAHT